MMQAEVIGVEELTKKFKEIARNIPVAADETLKEVGELGWQFAQNLVPKDQGFLSEAVINFPENKETWVIISAPPRDHTDFPLNVLIEQGDINSLNWGNRNSPKTGEFGFMEKTAEFLDKEFSERLNIKIERTIK
jgi:hypothetical protein